MSSAAKAMKVPWSQWAPNYKFGYIASWIALVLCAVGLVVRLIEARMGMDVVFFAVVVANASLVLFMAPRWALDHEKEQQARERARQARAQLRSRPH
ncbi:permease [Corynebacterium lizhenjunii]|uniref:permease n=1 Tax=Corynebacterium lizhenjunii TaxID=2709394 RepID=UPI0013EC0887|nr:permease [Corynebacterium lizhenjunii]